MNQNLSLEVVKGWKLELSEYEGLPMSVEYNLLLYCPCGSYMVCKSSTGMGELSFFVQVISLVVGQQQIRKGMSLPSNKCCLCMNQSSVDPKLSYT